MAGLGAEMKKNTLFLSIIGILILLIPAGCGFIPRFPGDTIIDHRCLDLSQVPSSVILRAKADLVIAYGHTSHGSQLIAGMNGLDAFMGGTGLYDWNGDGSGGALQLRDEPFTGAADLGSDGSNTNYTAWATATRNYLSDPTNAGVNVIIWSWCGEVSGATEDNIADDYLANMAQLELDFPAVHFVYMTGHLDGTGLTGNLHQRNEQIRAYCRTNGKWLYDFADIESYDPDGNEYLSRYANDGCCYDADGLNGLETDDNDPTIPLNDDRNWAVDWQNAHTVDVDWYDCGAAHSVSLNANRKAYAAWWLWARLAGWN